MNKYELALVLNPTLDEETKAAEMTKVQELIARFGGTIEKIDDWGKRRLAYLINDEAEGYYVLYNFESAPEFPAELERIARITDGILRSLVVKK